MVYLVLGKFQMYVKKGHCNKFVVRSPLILIRPRNLGSDLTDLMTKINVLSYSIERLPLTPPHPCLSHPPSPCLSHHPSFPRLAGLTKKIELGGLLSLTGHDHVWWCCSLWRWAYVLLQSLHDHMVWVQPIPQSSLTPLTPSKLLLLLFVLLLLFASSM